MLNTRIWQRSNTQMLCGHSMFSYLFNENVISFNNNDCIVRCKMFSYLFNENVISFNNNDGIVSCNCNFLYNITSDIMRV